MCFAVICDPRENLINGDRVVSVQDVIGLDVLNEKVVALYPCKSHRRGSASTDVKIIVYSLKFMFRLFPACQKFLVGFAFYFVFAVIIVCEQSTVMFFEMSGVNG